MFVLSQRAGKARRRELIERAQQRAARIHLNREHGITDVITSKARSGD
jgi:hypothetical protein